MVEARRNLDKSILTRLDNGVLDDMEQLTMGIDVFLYHEPSGTGLQQGNIHLQLKVLAQVIFRENRRDG